MRLTLAVCAISCSTALWDHTQNVQDVEEGGNRTLGTLTFRTRCKAVSSAQPVLAWSRPNCIDRDELCYSTRERVYIAPVVHRSKLYVVRHEKTGRKARAFVLKKCQINGAPYFGIPIPSSMWNTRLTGAILYGEDGPVVCRNVVTVSRTVLSQLRRPRCTDQRRKRLRANWSS